MATANQLKTAVTVDVSGTSRTYRLVRDYSDSSVRAAWIVEESSTDSLGQTTWSQVATLSTSNTGGQAAAVPENVVAALLAKAATWER